MIRARNRYLVEEEMRLAPGAPHQRYVRVTVADTGAVYSARSHLARLRPFLHDEREGKKDRIGVGRRPGNSSRTRRVCQPLQQSPERNGVQSLPARSGSGR